MIPQDITRRFSIALRERGKRYYDGGRVRLTVATSDTIRAVVSGTMAYAVSIERNGRGRRALSCSCPYADEHDVCKHVWAVLLAADARGAFAQTPDETSSQARKSRSDTRTAAAPPVPEWKQRLKQLAAMGARPRPSGPAAPAELQQPLHYRLDLDQLRSSADVMVDVVAHGTAAPFTDEQWLRSADAADRDLARLLLGARPAPQYASAAAHARRFVIPPPMYDTTLRQICDTGRCELWSRTGTLPGARMIAWDPGAPWSVRFAVVAGDTGDVWQLRGWFYRAGEQLPIEDVELVTIHGLLLTSTALAHVDLHDAWPLVLGLRTGGPITAPADNFFDLVAELMLLPGAPHIELPTSANIEQTHPEPVPRLLLKRASRHGYDTSLRAQLSFSYDGLVVNHRHHGSALIDAERRRIVHRAPEREQKALDHLLHVGAQMRYDWQTQQQELVVGLRRFQSVVHTLVAEGWQVEADGQLYRAATRTEAHVRSGIDWFELDGGVAFGEQQARLPELLAALQRGEKTIRLDDGSLGMLPLDWLRRYSPVAALGITDDSADAIRYTRAQAGLLDALLATQPEVRIDEAFARMREELRSFERVTAEEPPAGFRGELRGYQKEGLGWMSFLRQLGLGGCLADDMGLGKTVQVLALLEQRRHAGAGPALVVVPKSLVFNWLREAARFTPTLRVRDHTGVERRRNLLDPGEFDLLITTYGTLRQDAPELRELEFDYVILDEAQAIKNANTASAKAARLLRARHRLALSGTPIENNLNELWSLFEFLNPGMLGAAPAFAAFRSGTRSDEPDGDGRAVLARALRPFLLRRTKEQVAPELPPRVEQTLIVELEAEQRALYDSLRDHYRLALLQRVKDVGIKRAKIQILEALLRLRQAALHPALIDPKRAGAASAKLNVLLETLTEVGAEGHRALVFSQFTSFLALVRQRLDKAGIAYEYLDGRTRDRQARVDRFQADASVPVFLISLRAGGQGLNLTAADYVFVLDPWWNPAVEAQAIDRTHRIGQDKHVIALRLIARDTVEEKVLELQRTKRELADAILNADAGLIARITREDLELLLN